MLLQYFRELPMLYHPHTDDALIYFLMFLKYSDLSKNKNKKLKSILNLINLSEMVTMAKIVNRIPPNTNNLGQLSKYNMITGNTPSDTPCLCKDVPFKVEPLIAKSAYSRCVLTGLSRRKAMWSQCK